MNNLSGESNVFLDMMHASCENDAAAARSCRRDLSHPRARADSAGDEPRRDAPAAGRRQQSQSPGRAQPRLWLRTARRGDRAAQGHKQIDSAQRIIRIEQSKGRKDRNVMLSPETLGLLRQWWKVRPSRYDAGTPIQERWLFPSRKTSGRPMTTRQLSRLFHEAADAAGIKKSVPLHALRHSFATHILDRGTDIRIIQALLGHEKLDTTARYTRVATGFIANIESPLDMLEQRRKKQKNPQQKAQGTSETTTTDQPPA